LLALIIANTRAICKARLGISVAKTSLQCDHCEIISIFHAEVVLGLEQVVLSFFFNDHESDRLKYKVMLLSFFGPYDSSTKKIYIAAHLCT
jgi:hypothetical protein